MKINYIYLDGYKNLNKLELEFEDKSCVNALIGNNGSGKSNILEALTIVFTALYNDKPVEFTYEIHYIIEDHLIVLSNKKEEQFLCDGKKVKKSDKSRMLPRSIFLYYCGETDRLKELSLAYTDKKFENALKYDGEISSKYLSFVGLKEFPAALLANARYENTTFTKVCDLMGIDTICGPITLKLKRPAWSKKADITQDSFWNAQGTVAMLLHEMKDAGELIIIDRDHAKIVIQSVQDIKWSAESPYDLFIRFELLLQAGILDEIVFTIIKDGVELKPSDLSEGEKQLAQLLSLLEATRDYRALFLLDEFDSFLHPNWQRRFAEIIDGIKIQGQVLFTTHSPLTLGKMRKENILILKDGEIFYPSADTFNRDITEILDEIMDVKKRPIEVENAIKDFRNAVMHGNKDVALTHLNTLKGLLSKGDPFWVTVEHYMARLG